MMLVRITLNCLSEKIKQHPRLDKQMLGVVFVASSSHQISPKVLIAGVSVFFVFCFFF